MSEKEGTLRMMASGRWAVCRPGETPHEITSGELFRVEVAGELRLTPMEYRHNKTAGYYRRRLSAARRSARRDRWEWVKVPKAFSSVRRLSWSSCRPNSSPAFISAGRLCDCQAGVLGIGGEARTMQEFAAPLCAIREGAPIRPNCAHATTYSSE